MPSHVQLSPRKNRLSDKADTRQSSWPSDSIRSGFLAALQVHSLMLDLIGAAQADVARAEVVVLVFKAPTVLAGTCHADVRWASHDSDVGMPSLDPLLTSKTKKRPT